MEFKEVIEKRKSVRDYTGESIPEETLEYIIRSGSLAPTSRNRNPCSFFLIRDKAVLERLAVSKKTGAAFAAYANAVIAVAADSEKADTWIEDSSIALTYMMLAAEEQELGCCWIQIRMRTSEDGRDAEANVRDILGLPEKFRIVGMLALGCTE